MGKTGRPTELHVAQAAAHEFLEVFHALNAPEAEAFIGGSVRRWRPIVSDVDYMVVSECSLPELEWPAGWHVTPKQAWADYHGVRQEVWWCPPQSVGPMMMFITGSAQFNVMCRRHAQKHGLKLSQYGIFDKEHRLDSTRVGAGQVHVETMEKAAFQVLGIPYVPPEERDDVSMSGWSQPRVA